MEVLIMEVFKCHVILQYREKLHKAVSTAGAFMVRDEAMCDGAMSDGAMCEGAMSGAHTSELKSRPHSS